MKKFFLGFLITKLMRKRNNADVSNKSNNLPSLYRSQHSGKPCVSTLQKQREIMAAIMEQRGPEAYTNPCR